MSCTSSADGQAPCVCCCCLCALWVPQRGTLAVCCAVLPKLAYVWLNWRALMLMLLSLLRRSPRFAYLPPVGRAFSLPSVPGSLGPLTTFTGSQFSHSASQTPTVKPTMGITGILPLMKAATTDVKLEKLSGTVAVVDTNGWMHRACYSCADKVYLKEETDQYIKYCINMCGVLQKHNITPILVFDGQSLPAKAETKAKRTKRKEEVKAKINELLRKGDNRGARWLMRQCVDVTFEMVHRVIVACRQEKIDYIVAPFEADAQMAYLVNQGIADYAITEDSDLLVFGCKKTLYKLDRENEKGSMLSLERLDKCFKDFSERKFQYMCILSGCDYLENIPNVGLGRARKFFENLKVALSIDSIQEELISLPQAIGMEGKVRVSKEYIKGFVRAVQTFDHQLIFSPFVGKITHMKNLRGGLQEHQKLKLGEYAGEFFDDKVDEDFVIHYVAGNIHPKTLEKIDPEFVPFPEEGGKFAWFSEEIRQRVASKKTMGAMVSSLFVPESPVKAKPSDSKRKNTSPVKLDTDSGLPSKRIKAQAKKSSEKNANSREPTKSDSPVKPRRKSLALKDDEEEVEVKVVVSQSKTEISRSSSRNIFRKSDTQAETKVSSRPSESDRKSPYFQKKKEVAEIESRVDTPPMKAVRERISVKKAASSPTKATLSDDSDFGEDALESQVANKKTDLNVSLSSIDEEDKDILSCLNGSPGGTQSSGYASQRSPTNSQSPAPSPSSSQSQTSFTKLKPSVNGGSSASKKRITRASSSTAKTSSPDIRAFFGKRN